MNKEELLKEFRNLKLKTLEGESCDNCNDCNNCNNCNNCILCIRLDNKKKGFWVMNKEVTEAEFMEVKKTLEA